MVPASECPSQANQRSRTKHGPTPNDGVFTQSAAREVQIVVEHFEIDGFGTLKSDIDAAQESIRSTNHAEPTSAFAATHPIPAGFAVRPAPVRFGGAESTITRDDTVAKWWGSFS